MVDFGGWDMPVNYGSQIEEHHAVRRDAGIFDVSHMCVIDVRGPRVREFFSQAHRQRRRQAQRSRARRCTAACSTRPAASSTTSSSISSTRSGSAWWSTPARATRTSPGCAASRRSSASSSPSARTSPCSRCRVRTRARRWPGCCRPNIATRRWRSKSSSAASSGDWFVARTGYTGEDGFEIMLPAGEAPAVWRTLNERGVKSAGLGARDTLRLEAAMNLYGNDMDESQNPLESGLAWTVSFENPARDFIGRKALEALKAAGLHDASSSRCCSKTAACCAATRRSSSRAAGEGEITSGTFSPDDGEIHRAGARAARHRRHRAGRHPRQAVERARGEGAVRASRQDTRQLVTIFPEQST